jgi:hypothetical protein
VYGEGGRPLYSWRVLLLPYIEEDKLYAEFRLDEPWDSEHNVRLIDRMPRLYRAPWTRRVDVPPGHTVYRVFVGPGTPFELGARVRLKDDFPDGLGDTILFVEAGRSRGRNRRRSRSTRPDRCGSAGLFRNGYRACTADGSYRFIRDDADECAVWAAATRNGGEATGPPW